MIAYPAQLDVPPELVRGVARLLPAERRLTRDSERLVGVELLVPGGAGSTRSYRGADMIANGRTPPCSLTVGEGGRWVGMVDEPAQQHGHDEEFGPVLAADSALRCLALCDNVRRDRGVNVTEELWWRDEDAEYIRHRSSRYPGATDLEPAWTLEAAADPRRIVLDPNPKSRTGAVRIIGYSACARFVITIIATGAARAGVTAWKSSGADLRDYEGQG